MILLELRKMFLFKKFSDDQLLYITGPIYRSTNKNYRNRLTNLQKHPLFEWELGTHDLTSRVIHDINCAFGFIKD